MRTDEAISAATKLNRKQPLELFGSESTTPDDSQSAVIGPSSVLFGRGLRNSNIGGANDANWAGVARSGEEPCISNGRLIHDQGSFVSESSPASQRHSAGHMECASRWNREISELRITNVQGRLAKWGRETPGRAVSIDRLRPGRDRRAPSGLGLPRHHRIPHGCDALVGGHELEAIHTVIKLDPEAHIGLFERGPRDELHIWER